MAHPSAILAAAKAAQRARNQASTLGGGMSPFLAQMNTWGAPLAYGQNLPRPYDEFSSGQFGPLAPILPMGVDEIPAGEDRAEPRRFQYPIAWNVPIGTPGTEGLGKLASFETLRLLADISSLARACIKLRKAEIRALAWDIMPTDDAAKAMRGDKKARGDFDERKAAAIKFFQRPDPNYADFSSWLDAMIEDILVTDALSIYLQPCRVTGKGVLGSDLGALALVDGSSIRPLLALDGSRPRPPAPAFQQYLYGAPRSDLITMILGDDIKDLDEPVAEYRGDQLLYLPYQTRDWTPYGFAPAEGCIVPILAHLNRQRWQQDFYGEGTVPSVFISPGDPNITPQQISTLQDGLNAIAGDPAWKHKIIVLPSGSRIDPMKNPELADQFDEVIISQITMGYDVMPMELGVSPRVSATQSAGAASQMAKACYSEGTEVYTRAGWKLFEDVKVGDEGDEFATRNPKTGEFEWQHATAYHEYDYDGELVEFETHHGRQVEGLRLWVTPNHRMVTVEPATRNPLTYKEYIREAGSIRAKRISIPITASWEGSGPQSVRFGRYEWSAVDFAALLGAWLAEGHLGRSRGTYKYRDEWRRRPEGHVIKAIVISQMPESKGYQAYNDLLTRMLGREPGRNANAFRFVCADLWDYLNRLGHSWEKYIPEDVKDWSKPALQALLDHYLLGDGYLENGEWRAKTVSKQLASDLQEIALKLGMSATITLDKKRDVVIRGRTIKAENCRDCYLVRFNKSLTRRMTIDRVQYAGKVRCVTVPNGVIYVQKNGIPVWCGNSQSTQQRKSTRPLLNFLKSTIFDPVLQEVCGQHDMQWWWEGLEEGEDEESRNNVLIQRVNAGLMSHDEARTELGLDPWGLPLTSEPGVLLASGFVPLGAIDPATGLPAAQQPIQPQEAGVTPVAGEGWVEAEGGGAAAKPPTAGTSAPSSPAQAGATAANDQHARQGSTQAAKPSGAQKPVNAGKSAKPAKPVWQTPGEPLSGEDATKAVFTQLAEDYPASALSWVLHADWHGPVRVPVDQIDTSHADTWQAAGEAGKVDRFKKKIRRRLKDDTPIKPVVLVQTPNNHKLIVIDGHHRTLAYQALGEPVVAWIGQVHAETGPWLTLHNVQYPADQRDTTDSPSGQSDSDGDLYRRAVKNAAADNIARLSSSVAGASASKVALVELDTLGRHLRKGARLADWQSHHLPTRTLALVGEHLAKGHGVEAAIAVARSSLSADDDQEGEQPGPRTALSKADRGGWEAWRIDGPLAAFYAARLRAALTSVIGAREANQIAAGWLQTAAGMDPEMWLQLRYPHLGERIEAAVRKQLGDLYRQAWAVGNASATAARTGSTVDWAPVEAAIEAAVRAAKPVGRVDASYMVYDQQSLTDWLTHYGIDTIKSVAQTRLGDLAKILEMGLDDGSSTDSLAGDITDLGVTSDMADMIAVTEIARATSQAALANYQANRVTEVRWLTASSNVCPICQRNEDAGPIPTGSSWPSGQDSPPAHPRCRCSCAPARVRSIGLPNPLMLTGGR